MEEEELEVEEVEDPEVEDPEVVAMCKNLHKTKKAYGPLLDLAALVQSDLPPGTFNLTPAQLFVKAEIAEAERLESVYQDLRYNLGKQRYLVTEDERLKGPNSLDAAQARSRAEEIRVAYNNNLIALQQICATIQANQDRIFQATQQVIGQQILQITPAWHGQPLPPIMAAVPLQPPMPISPVVSAMLSCGACQKVFAIPPGTAPDAKIACPVCAAINVQPH